MASAGCRGSPPDATAVTEYLDFFARAHDYRGEERKTRVAEIMAFTELEPLSTRLININWYHWAVHELPRYKAETFNPDIYKANLLSLITKEPEHLIREHAWRKLGKMPPDSSVLVWALSAVDPTQAPEGTHIVASEQFVLAADRMSKREWLEYKKQNADSIMNYWQEYAPNMNW